MALAEHIIALEGAIKTKRAEWQTLADAVEQADTATAEQIDALKAGNKELAELVEKRKALTELANETSTVKAEMDGLDSSQKEALEKARQLSREKPPEDEEKPWYVDATKALLGDRGYSKDRPYIVEKSIKALFNEGAFTAASGNVPGYYAPVSNEGYPPELRRDPALFTPDAVRPVQFWNTIQQIPTMRPTDVYMRETVNADGNAPFTGEGGAYIEDPGFDYNEASNPIKDLGVWYGVTRDIIEDEPMMESVLGMRIMERMSRHLDNAFLNQTSGANNFLGINQIAGIPNFARAADDSLQVSITRAIEAINGPAVTGIANSGGQAMCDAIYVTVPVYWEFMRQQDALGNFMVSMGLREAPQLRVAGVPVMQCQALPAGTILCMDRSFVHIRDRRSVDVYWMEQMVTAAAAAGSAVVPAARRQVVADARAVITVRREAAVCRITGA